MVLQYVILYLFVFEVKCISIETLVIYNLYIIKSHSDLYHIIIRLICILFTIDTNKKIRYCYHKITYSMYVNTIS